MWIYIAGYIVTFIAFIILCLKNNNVVTIGDLLMIMFFSFASWATIIAVLILFLIDSGFFEKPIIKRKK